MSNFPPQGERTEHFRRENDAATRDTYIRNLNEELYHRIRVTAVERGVPIGQIINEAMQMWLAAQPNLDATASYDHVSEAS